MYTPGGVHAFIHEDFLGFCFVACLRSMSKRVIICLGSSFAIEKLSLNWEIWLWENKKRYRNIFSGLVLC